MVALDDDASDALFQARPVAAQATTAISQQSRPLVDEAELRSGAAELAATSGTVPRPDSWGAYQLQPQEIEFWHGSADRLHRRLRYDLVDEQWTPVRLQP